jgi:hypothetical protein
MKRGRTEIVFNTLLVVVVMIQKGEKFWIEDGK